VGVGNHPPPPGLAPLGGASPRAEGGQLATPIARHIWSQRYRSGTESSLADTWRRIAGAVAQAETGDRRAWRERFRALLTDFRFLPGGRIQAGSGTQQRVSLFNCFVMGPIADSLDGIFRALREGALTMQQGGGVGYDFSTLRPHGAHARGSVGVASGPVSFMDVWDAMCATIQSTGARRGAMMATLRIDHPDIETFIAAKQHLGRLRHFNLSVLVSDAFLRALRDDAAWALIFPADRMGGTGETVTSDWPGEADPVPCRVARRVPARRLWNDLLRASFARGEPGVLFIDRINHLNNLWYSERIAATNPCGEVPLPPYGACDLGSINLAALVRDPFTPRARLDQDQLRAIVPDAVRFLDDVIDVSRFPLQRQREVARRARRIGLGITGLADALLMLGLRYDSAAAREIAAETMRTVCHEAYAASIALARKKGAFPAFDRDRYLAGPFIAALPAALRDGIARDAIRNSHLTAIAPAGTISLLAGNVSSGIEPVFAADQRRSVLDRAGQPQMFALTDHAVGLWRALNGRSDGVPPALATATELSIAAHLDMQAALQPFVDNAISKTIHVPADCDFETYAGVYASAYQKGLKGCTTFRPHTGGEAVLHAR
jgi:ribonucleoside-diphosphate reductase alpha chain